MCRQETPLTGERKGKEHDTVVEAPSDHHGNAKVANTLEGVHPALRVAIATDGWQVPLMVVSLAEL
jgi:hypothetical protein